MISDTLQAWVIHKYWSGDTSARVVFFTKQYGLINCLYKGGRTPKKQALIQAFLPLWLVMDLKRDAYFVRHLEIAASPAPLMGPSLIAGFYMNELLYYLLKSRDPHESLYCAYGQALEALAMMAAPDRLVIESILRRFEWVLLTACGLQMSLTHDARSARPIASNLFYQFIAGEGLIEAKTGIHGEHILAMANNDLSNAAVLGTAKHIMRRAIHYLLDGKELKTRALYETQRFN